MPILTITDADFAAIKARAPHYQWRLEDGAMLMAYGDRGLQDRITKLSDRWLYHRHVHVGHDMVRCDTLRAQSIEELFTDEMEIVAHRTIHI